MKDMLRLAGVTKESLVDGPGLNYVMFFQGCSHNCAGCHNPSTHDFTGGEHISMDTIYKEIEASFSTGVTLSGGDPMDAIMHMHPDTFDAFLPFLSSIRNTLGKLIICYTGYYLEDLTCIRQQKLLKYCDILIDGPFILEFKSELPYRGSKNQHVIPLTDKGRKIFNEE